MLPRILGLLLLLCVGCAVDPPSAPPMKPVGERAIRVIDGVPLRHYGPDMPPAVRVDGDPGAWTLQLDGRPLPTRVERLGEYVFLVGDAVEAADGPARLEVAAEGRVLAGWTVWYGPAEGLTAIEGAVRAMGRRGWSIEVDGWRALAALNRWLDRPTEAARALRIAAQRLRQRGNVGPAARLIDEAGSLDAAVGSAAGQAYGAYARAGLSHLVGELAQAEAAAVEAVRRARRARLPALAIYGEALAAGLAGELGRHAEAREALDRLAGQVDGQSADLRLTVYGNRGWVLLEGWRLGALEVDPAEIEAAFETALAAAEGRPDEQANQHANLAALARMVGDRAALDRHIAAHDALDPGRKLQPGLFVGLLDGHRALLDGDGATALARFAEVERRARERVDDPVGAYLWQAKLGQARARRALGDGAGALADYRAALAIVERSAARTALQGQRALFFADRGALFEEAFAAALAAGAIDVAFTVADGARSRVVRDLEVSGRLGRLDAAQRAEWGARIEGYLALRAAYEGGQRDGELMAADTRARWQAERRQQRAALQAAFDAAHDWLDRAAPVSGGGVTVAEVQRRLAPDEALWLAHRGEAWHGFLVTAGGVSHTVGGPAPAALPDGIAHLMLVGVPPSAVPPLWDRASTALWTHAGAIRAAPPGAGPVVVIGDPDQTLAGARAEAVALAKQLGGEHLAGAAVDREVMLSALRRASTLHFAGHGVLVPASPWDAHLRLADGERLTTEDVLMARVSPRLVVLSSCETGRQAPLASAIGLSLADAFVAAGAASVVSAERPVPDAGARGLMQRFYAAGGRDHPAEALRTAALAARAAGDPLWDAFVLRGAR